MKLGYTIVYVADVAQTLDFYERAFGLARRFLHESGSYGELETGATTLAFAAHEMGRANLPGGYTPSDKDAPPLGWEIAFVTPDVNGAFTKAVEQGAIVLSEPRIAPWGQTIASVRDLNGVVIELGSPVSE